MPKHNINGKEQKYVRITNTLYMNGKVVGKKCGKLIFGLSSETSAHNLRDIAYFIHRNEDLISPMNHRKWDILESLGKYIGSDISEIEAAWDKYFLNMNKTVEEEFNKQNEGNDIVKPGEYLLYTLGSFMEHFSKLPTPVKYGFAHYLVKYVWNDNYDEIRQDVEVNCADHVKEWVKQAIEESNKENEKRNKANAA